MKVPRWLRWIFGLLIGALVTVAPYLYYRYEYTFAKRLRVVDPGRVYRCGWMTAPGFRAAISRYGIRFVLNVNDEVPDPDLAEGYFTSESIKESELCKEMNVKYGFLCLDLLEKRDTGSKRPHAIEQFLALMDNPANYPMLIHCRAGLHRTGCMVALYRMEYDHWPMEKALWELKAHGFGEYASTVDNAYIAQYVVNYKPGIRQQSLSSQQSGSRPPSADSSQHHQKPNPLTVPKLIPAGFATPTNSESDP